MMTLAQWRAKVANWKGPMDIWVNVRELRGLIQRCEEAEALVEQLVEKLDKAEGE